MRPFGTEPPTAVVGVVGPRASRGTRKRENSMLLDLFPKFHRRYTSLPIIGPTLDGYGTWLLKQGYSTDRVREHFRDRKSTRLNSSHGYISYAVFCLKKKKKKSQTTGD